MLNFHRTIDNTEKTATFVKPTNNTHTMNTTITNKEKNGNRGYFVYHMGEVFFAIFSYGDGDVEFLSKPYRTQKGADKYLTEYRKQANA